jgi:dihydrolipoamide dehydrogenase
MNEYDVLIIGGGPGGYAAAVRAANLGLSVAMVEKEKVGGVCVNTGCVPAKTMLKYAKLRHKYDNHESDAWKTPPLYKDARAKSAQISGERSESIEKLLQQSGVELFKGTARLTGAGSVEIKPSGKKLKARNIIIATGSRPRQIPGFKYDGVNVVTTREVLQLGEAPASAVIVGSGATGIEIATVWGSFGTKVTVLEMLPYVMGTDDEDVLAIAKEYFSKNGVEIKTGVKVETVKKTPQGVEVTYTEGGKQEKLIVEKAMIAAGVVPNSENLGLEDVGVKTEKGYIKIDNRMRTSVPGIYAIGDVTGKLALALTATEQGIAAVETIAGNKTEDIVYENIPRCIYAGIQIAAVGICEKAAKDLGYDVATVTVPVTPFAKKIDLRESGSFMKLFCDAKNDKVLGALMIGSDVTDQIAVPTRMINLGSMSREITKVMSNWR